ncbi:PITH domain-containing protein GA19395 [Coccinella septempunctata]|uniref:PITH domain-containing protein GA19395 n=1 Tax=Coccinella septempunctata TaxID=41139 RepID=UPI001D095741|nr:PITH domain-containing protein GA19395 [Coccinella septempunctata]
MPPHGGHGSTCCEGDSHKNETQEMGVEYSLYTKINKDNLECLNEECEGSGKTIFKPWEERLNFDTVVESDADAELLFNIPFTGNIKLKGIIVVGEDNETHPSRMRIFKNRPSMTFDDVSIPPDQEFVLHHDTQGSLEYATKVVTFNNVHHLTLHFPSNFGGEKTKIYYIGLRGEFFVSHHHGVTICNYESAPNISDHKNQLDEISGHAVQ